MPTAEQTCASCHYDYDPVASSDAIEIDGWPASFVVGKRYLLTLRFSPPAADIAGFQVTAVINGESRGEDTGDGDETGVFVCGADGIEFVGAGIRSTLPRRVEDGLSWTFAWRAPDNAADIAFHVAASAANDDASPFGDVIHYRTFRSSTQR